MDNYHTLINLSRLQDLYRLFADKPITIKVLKIDIRSHCVTITSSECAAAKKTGLTDLASSSLCNAAMPPAFDQQSYWHNRFLSESTFEWLISSETFLDVAAPFLCRLPRDAPILQLGCGTSDLHIHLRRHGFTNVTNLDYEPLAIERSQAMERDEFGDIRTTHVVADVLGLDLGRKFDLVLDKSTADAIACCEGPSVLTMTHRVKNHLTENGVWLSLSFSASRFETDDGTLPLRTEIVDRLRTIKGKPSDPDVFHYCHLLQNRTASTTLGSR